MRIILAAATIFAFATIHVARGEFIRSFDVDVHLNRDSSLDIAETIVLDFESTPRHGINRFIPVRYERYGNTYSISLKVREVTDGDGRALKYTTSTQGRNTNLRIGDPNETVTGVHTYRVYYLARRAVNFFDGAPEVYWNATGDEWPYAIRAASLRFFPPQGTSTRDVRTKCFVGPPGSTREGQVTAGDEFITFLAPAPLAPGEGMTIVAGLPKGATERAGLLTEIMWWLSDWWPAVVFPLLTGGFMFWRWRAVGRDVGAGGAIAVEWNPPKDLSPAEVGTLIDEKCDMPDVVSTLVDLAARGYLTIEETESAGFLFLSTKDYRFTKHHPPPNSPPLLPHEQSFYGGLFKGNGNTVLLSDLKNQFYVHLPAIRKSIYESLTDKQFFTSNPETVRQIYAGVGIVMMIVGLFVSIWLLQWGFLAYGLGLILSGIIVTAMSKAMPAKTWEGTKTLREILGFQRFMALVEKERIAKIAKDDPTIFGRLLPYAMVLGVADQWASAFAGLLTEPPDWYRTHQRGPFSPYLFIHDLGGGMRTMGSTFASHPSSSGGSGGSGFSGGSSGGGFGGGGGSSW
jgi:uncharacterized membrane protein YgcG